MGIHRRDALIRLGMGTAGLLVGAGCGAQESPKATPPPKQKISTDAADLAVAFRSTPHDRVFDVATGAIDAGADHEILLAAVFLAGVHDITPNPVGGMLHCVMMVESVYQLSGEAGRGDALLGALWNLDYFKQVQAEDAQRGDWVLPPAPTVSFSGEDAARRELIAGLEDWDHERADRGITGLLQFTRDASVFELLWPYATRSSSYVGHKIIYAAHVQRTLDRIGWRYAEPAVRSLVAGLLNYSVARGGKHDEGYHRALDMIPDLPDHWLAGKDDPDQSLALLRKLRTASAEQAQLAVVEALNDGVGVDSIWDGIRLIASECFYRRPGNDPMRGAALLPVHTVTVANAFGHVWRTTRSERTRQLALLQAAAWLPFLRDHLVRRIDLSMDGPGIDSLQPIEAEVSSYLAQLRGPLVRKAVESHQYKYAAAIAEDVARVHPRWAPLMLAPALPYLPTRSSADTEVHDRSVSALKRAGIA